MHGKSNIKLQFHIYGIKTQGVFLCRIPPKDGRRRSKHVGGLLYDCLRLHLTVVKLLDEKCKQNKMDVFLRCEISSSHSRNVFRYVTPYRVEC